MHYISTTFTDYAAFFSITEKEYYRLFEFLNDTSVHMQPEVLNRGTFTMFKKKF